jgi:hypothetical protein
MGLQADARALAKLTGKEVRECKKALKAAGSSLRNKSLIEKGAALFGPAKEEAPPAPPPAPLVEKELDPEPEAQVQDPEPEPQVAKAKKKSKKKKSKKVVETNDADDMGSKIEDES